VRKALKKVIADTTVMPKAIAFPTDAKLYFKSIQAFVKMADNYPITLR
jgi:IS5 family transposase